MSAHVSGHVHRCPFSRLQPRINGSGIAAASVDCLTRFIGLTLDFPSFLVFKAVGGGVETAVGDLCIFSCHESCLLSDKTPATAKSLAKEEVAAPRSRERKEKGKE